MAVCAPPPELDAYDLYTLCAQDPPGAAAFLRAVHPGRPHTLREDFAGAGAICRAWAALHRAHHAVAVDKDPHPLSRLAGLRRVRAVAADVMDAADRADVICALNFPIGYWHTRDGLLEYLRRTRARLEPRGVFVCDTYAGRNAFSLGRSRCTLRAPSGERITYTWEHRRADPLTGRVVNAMHFRIQPDRGPARVLRDAFVYDWRLWSIPELRDAIREAGFASCEVHTTLADAVDHRGRALVRPADPAELEDDFVAYLAAR